MANIRDVSRAAGVSTATVSRALSGRGYVNAATRERVLAAAAELGYVPNALARGLKTRRSGLVGLIVPQLYDPIFATIAQGVEEVASAAGLQVMLGASLSDRHREADYIAMMAAQHVDGLILCPAHDAADASWELASRLGLPTVFVDDRPAAPVDAVRSDHLGGARALTRRLLDLGHRRIGFIIGDDRSVPGRERIAGYRAELAAAGIPQDPALLRVGAWSVAFGDAAARDLMALPDPPTAIFSGGALMTAGAMQGLRALGRRVPEDVAVVGFDELPMALAIDPFLTVAAHPVADICRQATQLLVDRLEGTETGPPRETVLPVEVIVRRSCGAGIAPRAS